MTTRNSTCSCGAPEGRGALDGLAVEGDAAGLLDAGAALVHQVLHHLVVPIAAAQHQRRRAVRLGRDQPRHLLPRPVVQENLKMFQIISTINNQN